MKKQNNILSTINLYRGAIVDVFRYQVLASFVASIGVLIFSRVAMLLISSTGRVAITTGDFDFLFKTWQGPLIIIIALISLFFFVALDLNSQIIYASKYLKGKADLVDSIKEGFVSIKDFFTFEGLGIVLYISLIAPIIGFGFTISLTNSLRIPNFISSVIFDNPTYKLLYYLFLYSFIALGIMNIFIIHGIVLSGLKPIEADNQSRELVKKNFKDFVLSHISFFIFYVLTMLLILVCTLIMLILILIFVESDGAVLTTYLFVGMSTVISILFISGCFKFFYLLRMTELYYRYRGEEIVHKKYRSVKRIIGTILVCLFVELIVFGIAYIIGHNFDDMIPKKVDTKIIAHRAGGAEAPENTIVGIDKAIKLEADGAEIDIQRTKDGNYVVNHDNDFYRLCGEKRRSQEMYYREIMHLVINDPRFPDDPQPVALYEDMLLEAYGKIILFVELKGDTADQKMADDAVSMIKKRGMEENCVIISLKYSLIDYIERNYPEIQTGYLMFASFGNIGELNCDFVGLEEETATPSNIRNAHAANKKVMVWTPNSYDSQKKFLLSLFISFIK